MKTLKIIATLLPAVYDDLFTSTGTLRESVSIFYKKNGVTRGPRFLENEYADEVLEYLQFDFFYIIKDTAVKKEYHPKEAQYKLKLREASAADFQWSPNFPRYERVYYRDIGNRMIQGPLYYMPNTNLTQFEENLLDRAVYVPAEGQILDGYQVQALAS